MDENKDKQKYYGQLDDFLATRRANLKCEVPTIESSAELIAIVLTVVVAAAILGSLILEVINGR